MVQALLPLVAVLVALAPAASAAQAPPAAPIAPDTAILQTRYYGTITLQHSAHVDRDAPCASCHGAGAPAKLELTAKVAHDRCIGCHQQQESGPTRCHDCHVMPAAEGSPELAAARRSTPQLAPAPPPAPPPIPSHLSAALAAAEAGSGSPPFAEGNGEEARAFRRLLELGWAAGRGNGPSARIVERFDSVLLSQAVEQLRSADTTRTYATFGAGVFRAGRGDVVWEAAALLGLGAVERSEVALRPVVGLRAGGEWRPRHPLVQAVCAGVTGVVDPGRGTSAKESALYLTLGLGFGLGGAGR